MTKDKVIHFTAAFGPLDSSDRATMNKARDRVEQLRRFARSIGFHDFSADEETLAHHDPERV